MDHSVDVLVNISGAYLLQRKEVEDPIASQTRMSDIIKLVVRRMVVQKEVLIVMSVVAVGVKLPCRQERKLEYMALTNAIMLFKVQRPSSLVMSRLRRDEMWR